MARYGWYEGERLKDLVGTARPEEPVRAAEPVSFANFQAAREPILERDHRTPAGEALRARIAMPVPKGDELLESLSLYDPSVAAETLFINGDLIDNTTGEVLMQEADWSRPERVESMAHGIKRLIAVGISEWDIREAAYIITGWAQEANNS